MNLLPVAGTYLNHVPAVSMTVDDAIGERLVRTGAFVEGGDGGDVPGGVELESNLGHYDPPADPAAPIATPEQEG